MMGKQREVGNRQTLTTCDTHDGQVLTAQAYSFFGERDGQVVLNYSGKAAKPYLAIEAAADPVTTRMRVSDAHAGSVNCRISRRSTSK